METRKIWMRLGITVRATADEMNAIINGNQKALKKVLCRGDYEIEGSSYIPQVCVQEYADTYNDANVKDIMDIEFEIF